MSLAKWGCLLASAVLLGCGSQVESTKPLNITIAHVNDHLSHLSADKVDLQINNRRTRVEVGGFPRVVAKIKEIESGNANTLKVHAGNAITGHIFYTLFEGEADAAQMQNTCFDVMGVGSHEFNDGEMSLREFLSRVNSTRCETIPVSSNINFKVGTSPLALSKNDDFVKPYAVKTFGDEKVGIVGVIPAVKTSASSNARADTKFKDELKSIQKAVKALHKEGVNKIVLVSTLGYDTDAELASQLSGVGVIIGADSHTLMGNYSSIGLDSGAVTYPAIHNDNDGRTVCIAHAWHYSYAVGELNISWDENGKVKDCGGKTHLLFGEGIQVKNTEGKWAQPAGNEMAGIKAVLQSISGRAVSVDAAAQDSLGNFERRVARKQRVVVGEAPENLCLERIPGQGKSALCDASETAIYGSHISNIVAKSFMISVKTADFAIQNAGGVRADLAAGQVTLGDIQNLLPFNNTLVELDMTGAEIRQVLEDVFTYSHSSDGTTGSYPYASGIRWQVDIRRSEGNRIVKLEINPRLQGEWTPIDPSATYKVVTNNYIASGQDGYDTFGKIVKARRFRETFWNYTQPMSEYVRTVGQVNRLPVAEYSTQAYIAN